MISSYRLGDLILLNLNEDEKNEILNDFPNSIGSKFILEKKKNNDCNNIDIITNIVLEHMKQISELLPKNIEDSTLIHLRIGDVVAGNMDHEQMKRPLKVDIITQSIENDTNPKYLIGNCYFAKTSSTNYEECIKLSKEYLQNVLDKTGAVHFDSGNADIDLCCAVKSKVFVQGKGFFSKLIVEIRKKLNLNSNIETESTIPYY